MIINDALLALALALASGVNYTHKYHYSLKRHLLLTLELSFMICNMFMIQAIGMAGVKMLMVHGQISNTRERTFCHFPFSHYN
jgi:hypothetical protein